MLKVFLVEDEFIVRKGIRDNIDWAGEGFVFCGEATDGEMAYPLIKREKPDIIITDIRMPFMDGFELSGLVRKELPQSKIIILSGYEEFSYAQQALKFGVSEYILKPVSGDELIASVKNVAEKINQEREEREMKEEEIDSKRRLFEEIISGTMPIAKILECGKQLSLELSAPFFQIVLLKYYFNVNNETNYEINDAGAHIEDILTLNEEIKQISAKNENVILFDRAIDGNAVIIKENSLDRLVAVREAYIADIEAAFLKHDALRYFGGIGEPVERLTFLPKSFEGATRALSMRFMMDKNAFVSSDELDFTQKTGDDLFLPNVQRISGIKMERLGTFLRSGEKHDIQFFVDEFLKTVEDIIENSLLFKQYIVMDVYFMAVMFLEEISGAEELSRNPLAMPENVGDIANGEMVKEYIINVFNNVIDRRDEQRNKRYHLMVQRAKEYVAEYYANEDITLSDVAKYVNISPSYFSALFSRETGQSLISYLTEYRMNKAKELLRNSDMHSSEISAAVGYKDPHYFSYLFKKKQNCSPMQYRAAKTDG